MVFSRPLVLFICIILFIQSIYAQSDRIKESDIKVLTLSANEYATCRRSCPAPKQLSCSNTLGNTCSYPISAAQCFNQGTDDQGRVNWRCEAEMDNRVRFSNLKVSCEGYSYAGDPYVLKGSCILEYGLKSTGGGGGGGGSSSNGWFGLFGILPCLCCFVGIIGVFLVVGAITNAIRRRQGGYAPPPPGYNHGSGPHYYSNGGRSWRPGFFSGYAFGRMTGHHHHHGGYHHHHHSSSGFGGGGGSSVSTGFATSSSSR